MVCVTLSRLLRRIALPVSIATAVAAGAVATGLPSLASLNPMGGDTIDFLIWRSGDTIGSHQIQIDRVGNTTRVQIDIAIEVNMLFFTAYRYEHRNEEVWRDGRLVSINTVTNNDGEDLFVRGEAVPAGFEVTTVNGRYIAPATILPTSYWHPDTVTQSQLLDTQSGGIVDVSIENRGQTNVPTLSGAMPATHYDVDGELDADLYYDGQGRLSGIAFYPPDSDTKIVYELHR